MSARRKARVAAVEMLFEADQRSQPVLDVLAHRRGQLRDGAIIRPYTEEILRGYDTSRGAIDDALATYSKGWALSRMPAVDRAVLRVGAWEVIYNDDVPDSVAVSEATEVAAELSTDQSPSFVSGLLSRIAELKATLR